MTIPLFHVDAFTDRPFAGNPAAVCLLPVWKEDRWLQAVAREMNLSETAFLVKQADHFDLRWFTPATEVDLCGHATLASALVLMTEIDPAHPRATFHTRGGVLRVTREVDAVRAAGAAGAGRTAPDRVTAAVETFAGRALKNPKLAYVLLAEPVDTVVDAERLRD